MRTFWRARVRVLISNAEPNVMTPTRPMYIRIMIVNLPMADSSWVMPVLSPTVPMAEVASKSIWDNLKFAVGKHDTSAEYHEAVGDYACKGCVYAVVGYDVV